MVWTNETRPICGAGPLDSLARAALPKKLAGRSDLHLALIVLTMFLFFIVRYSPLSPAGLESRTMRSPQGMRRSGGVAVFAGFYLLLAAGTNPCGKVPHQALQTLDAHRSLRCWVVLFPGNGQLGPLFGDPVVSE